jgi:hypothetical protein
MNEKDAWPPRLLGAGLEHVHTQTVHTVDETRAEALWQKVSAQRTDVDLRLNRCV